MVIVTPAPVEDFSTFFAVSLVAAAMTSGHESLSYHFAKFPRERPLPLNIRIRESKGSTIRHSARRLDLFHCRIKGESSIVMASQITGACCHGFACVFVSYDAFSKQTSCGRPLFHENEVVT